jgi:hypothetical protein
LWWGIVSTIIRGAREGSKRAGWVLTQVRAATGAIRIQLLVGEIQKNSIPVIMCLWNRRDRLPSIIEQLDSQQTKRPIRLILWNNQQADNRHYRQILQQTNTVGPVASIEYVSSHANIGGLGRFVVARKLWLTGRRGPFMMLDDDQDISEQFIETLRTFAAPKRVAGLWAWNYLDSHWNRTRARVGESADYVGTGGCVCDMSIVGSPSFFFQLPRKYALLEDQWMCSYARRRGWELIRAGVDVTFVLHETNQFPALAELKDEFRQYLLALE